MNNFYFRILSNFLGSLQKAMREGYLFTSKDGAFSFANTVPGVFENAKNTDGFVEITPLKPSHRVRIQANICEDCRTIVFDY